MRETGYRIERRMNGASEWMNVGSVGADVTSFTDNSSGPGLQYRLVALGAAGESQPAAPIAPPLPGTPRSLVATAISPSIIRLEWPPILNETGIRIERSADGENDWSTIAPAGENFTAFADIRLSPASQFFDRVSGINYAGSSAPSNVVSATTWPKIFPAASGEWSGIVTPAGEFSYERSGLLELTVSADRAFTGRLTLGAKRVTICGKFAAESGAVTFEQTALVPVVVGGGGPVVFPLD